MLTNGYRLSTNKLVDGLETRLCDVAYSKRQDTAHLIFTSVPLLNPFRSVPGFASGPVLLRPVAGVLMVARVDVPRFNLDPFTVLC